MNFGLQESSKVYNMRFSCEKCRWKDSRRVRGKRFCTRCDWEENGGNENWSKEDAIFAPQETDSCLISQQDSRDVDMSENTRKPPADHDTLVADRDKESLPKFCFHCGNKLVNNSSQIQVNFCDQCGVQQTRRASSQSSSLISNESEYVLPQGINIPNNCRKTNLPYFNNSFQSNPLQHLGLSSLSNLPMSLPQDLHNNNSPIAINNIGEQMNSPPQRSSFSRTPYERPTSSPCAIPPRSSSFSTAFSGDNSYGFKHLFESQSPYSGIQSDTMSKEKTEASPFAKSPSTSSSISTSSSYESSYELSIQPGKAASMGIGLLEIVTEESLLDIVSNIDLTVQDQLAITELNIDEQMDIRNFDQPSILLSDEKFSNNLTPHLQLLLDGDVYLEKPNDPISSFSEESLQTEKTEQQCLKIKEEVIVESDEYGDTILHHYIQRNDTNSALKELQRLADTYAIDKETFLKYVNKRNERGEVALQSAIKNKKVEIIDNLLEIGVDVAILDHSGNNILHLIVLTSSTEKKVLRLLRGVFKYHAIYQNDFDALLNDQSKAFNNEGYTIVHEVTKRSFGDTLKFLKEKGANLNIVSRKEKTTALVMAAKQRNWPIVQILCSLDACVNIPTSSGWYPVHAAIEDGDKERLEFFMNHGVDIYGYSKIEASSEILHLCEKYMRRRRRKTAKSDRGLKRRRRCTCGSEGHIS